MTLPDMLQQMKGKRALVTGGLGFIGSNLARRLVDLGCEVTVVDALIPGYGGNPFNIHGIEDRLEVVIADTRDEQRMGELVRGKDYVFNLVGQVSHVDSMSDPYTDLEHNCRAHLSLLQACRKQNPHAKILFAATRQQYGRARSLPVDETQPLHPRDINGIHKMAGEFYHLLYGEVYGLWTTSLRLTNTYGPRQLMRHNRQGFAYWFIRQAIEGEPIAIYGDGSQLRDFTYVDDVVEAFLLAATHEEAKGQIFNLGGQQPFSLRQFADTLLAVCGKGSYQFVPFPEERKRLDIGNFYADWTKINTRLGWTPKVSLEEGLRRTVAYCRQHQQHYWP